MSSRYVVSSISITISGLHRPLGTKGVNKDFSVIEGGGLLTPTSVNTGQSQSGSGVTLFSRTYLLKGKLCRVEYWVGPSYRDVICYI